MSQSNVIFAFLLVSFLVWITVKGELTTYINYLTKGAASAQAASAGQNASAAASSGTPSTSQTASSSAINPAIAQSAQSIGAVLPFLA